MSSETNYKLIEQMFTNKCIFDTCENIENYDVLVCKDYDSLNLYECSKKFNDNIKSSNFIKNLSTISIRNTLFNDYLKISLLNEIDDDNWTEKIIYDSKNYNIQVFTKTENSLFCYSDLELDDDSFEYIWINNPYTLISISNNKIYLKTAFEISNTFQNEILKNFLQSLDKLELALSS